MKEHAGVDVRRYPAGKPPADAGAGPGMPSSPRPRSARKAASPSACLPLGTTTDTNQWIGALFLARRPGHGGCQGQCDGEVGCRLPGASTMPSGSLLSCRRMPRRGTICVEQQGTLSGRGSDLQSAQRLGGRQAMPLQVAEKCWTHGLPERAGGPFLTRSRRVSTASGTSKNKPAAKSACSSSHLASECREAGRRKPGADIPPHPKFDDFKIWDGGSAQGPRSITIRSAAATRSPGVCTRRRRRSSPRRF